MEKQIITIKIVTEGEKCVMQDKEIVDWYKEHVEAMFNPIYGTPKIDVKLERIEGNKIFAK